MSRRDDPRNGRIVWVRIFPDTFLGHTFELSAPAMGIYVRLFFAYLKNQGPLPDDHRHLAKIANVTTRTFRRNLDDLKRVFDVADGVWVDDLAEERIREFRAASNRNRQNVKHRWDVVGGGKLEAPDDE